MTIDELPSLTSSPPAQPAAPAPNAVTECKSKKSTPWRNTGKWFFGIACAQVALLLAFGGANAYTVATGTEVLLPTTIVDPWDMFRGNYITLGYEISTVDCKMPLSSGENVYVVLKQDVSIPSDKWVADRLEKTVPALKPGEVFIKGRVEWCGPRAIYVNNKFVREQQEAHIHYGIEQYYIPEGTGNSVQTRGLKVLVAVDKSGHPAIKKLVQ